MPSFELVPLQEALRVTGNRRAALIQEYVNYISSVSPGAAGRLEPAEGESVTAVRRRLNTAAKQLGTPLVVKRVDGTLFFWTGNGRRRRRRRQAEA